LTVASTSGVVVLNVLSNVTRYENVSSVLAIVYAYVLLGRATTEYR